MNKTKKIRDRLKFLKCPYLEGLNDEVVHELVLSESEARQRVIKWLLGKAHPALQRSVGALSAMKSDIGITARLTELLSVLGVCSANDYDLVKGSTPLYTQVKFLEALTGAIVCYDSFEDDSIDHWSSLSKSTNQSCDFLESLIMSENLSDILKSEITLIPADISHVTGINQETLENAKVPSVSELKQQVSEQQTATVELQLLLDKLSDQSSYIPLNSSAVAGCCTAIKISIDTTIQLMDDFVRCYHDDIQPWTNEETCQLGSLGNTSKQVHSLLVIVNELLDSSMRLEELCHKWEKIVNKKSIRDNNTTLVQRVQTLLKMQSTLVNE